MKNFNPGPDCTVEESLLGFRGRCSFKQYITNKPSKYGIKIFVLADNQTSYSVKSIYAGKGTFSSEMDSILPMPTKVVLNLADCIAKTSRNITTDNYYTSITLAKELQNQGLALIGTMKKNKRCIPPHLKKKS